MILLTERSKFTIQRITLWNDNLIKVKIEIPCVLNFCFDMTKAKGEMDEKSIIFNGNTNMLKTICAIKTNTYQRICKTKAKSHMVEKGVQKET